MNNLLPFKRVVTGHNSMGRAIISEAGTPSRIHDLAAVPGTRFYEIWNTTAMPVPVDNGADPTLRPLKLSPDPDGSLMRVVDIPPDRLQNSISDEDAARAFAEIGEALAHAPGSGTSGAEAPRHKLMHRTETLDYGIVVAGEVWLVLDEEEIHLKAGDIVIQRGTNHAWSNRTDEMARMVFVLLDGRFDASLSAVDPTTSRGGV